MADADKGKGETGGGDGLDQLFAEVRNAVGDIDVSSTTAAPNGGQYNPAAVSSLENSAFPTEMNCSQVFDQLLKCYSIGGQIRHYYRYGEMSYCYDKRSKLKFCLSTKLTTEADRQQKIKQWYMKNLAEQQAKHNTSESVWTSREEPLRRPFREDSAAYVEKEEN